MAEIIVPVVKINEVRPHKDADTLEIVEVGGWQVVVKKGSINLGDEVVHFPPQAVLPLELSEKLGVTKYLSKQRVKAIKLKGEVSHGFVASVDDVFEKFGEKTIPWKRLNGKGIMDALGITKYEPPVRFKSGDAETEVDEFPKYTSIENMRNNRNVFEDGEEVVITEKCHGSNVRTGMVNGEMFAGSKGVRRKPPQTPEGEPLVGFKGYEHNTYWYPWSLESVQSLMSEMCKDEYVESVILYGEIYGPRIQKLGYGLSKSELGYVAFDLMVNGEFLNYDAFAANCDLYGVPRVPEIDRVKFDYNKVKAYADGGTLLGGDHIREGVVVKPIIEGQDRKIGRKILKFVSSEYLAGDLDGVDDQA